MSRKRLYASLLGLLVVLVVLGGVTAITRAGSGAGENGVPVFRVERGRFVRRVPAQGNLRAVHATPIAVPQGSPVPYRIGWLAPDGARVKGGEVVVRFDNSDLVKQLTDARDDARSAGLKIRKQQIEAASGIAVPAGEAGPVVDRLLIAERDVGEGCDLQHQPDRLGPQLQAGDEADAVGDDRDDHQRADDVGGP